MPWNASCCPGSRMSAVPMSRSDLSNPSHEGKQKMRLIGKAAGILAVTAALATASAPSMAQTKVTISQAFQSMLYLPFYVAIDKRSEEHTSELQSLMRSSYAVFCLKKKIINNKKQPTHTKYSYTASATT